MSIKGWLGRAAGAPAAADGDDDDDGDDAVVSFSKRRMRQSAATAMARIAAAAALSDDDGELPDPASFFSPSSQPTTTTPMQMDDSLLSFMKGRKKARLTVQKELRREGLAADETKAGQDNMEALDQVFEFLKKIASEDEARVLEHFVDHSVDLKTLWKPSPPGTVAGFKDIIEECTTYQVVTVSVLSTLQGYCRLQPSVDAAVANWLLQQISTHPDGVVSGMAFSTLASLLQIKPSQGNLISSYPDLFSCRVLPDWKLSLQDILQHFTMHGINVPAVMRYSTGLVSLTQSATASDLHAVAQTVIAAQAEPTKDGASCACVLPSQFSLTLHMIGHAISTNHHSMRPGQLLQLLYAVLRLVEDPCFVASHLELEELAHAALQAWLGVQSLDIRAPVPAWLIAFGVACFGQFLAPAPAMLTIRKASDLLCANMLALRFPGHQCANLCRVYICCSMFVVALQQDQLFTTAVTNAGLLRADGAPESEASTIVAVVGQSFNGVLVPIHIMTWVQVTSILETVVKAAEKYIPKEAAKDPEHTELPMKTARMDLVAVLLVMADQLAAVLQDDEKPEFFLQIIDRIQKWVQKRPACTQSDSQLHSVYNILRAKYSAFASKEERERAKPSPASVASVTSA